MVFLSQKLMEIWYLLITEKFLFCSFRQWEIRSFFKRKSWWKYNIYWLLKRWYLLITCGLFLSQEVDGKVIFTGYWEVLVLNFSVVGKYGLIFSQKVDGKMIFGLFKLSMIFQDLGNLVFCAVLYKLKTQETQTFVFFSPRYAARFCSTLKVYCYRCRVSKIYESMRTQSAKLI